MTTQADLIVQLPRDSAVDRYLRAEPPPSVTSGRVVIEHLPDPEGGRLAQPPAGEVVLSVLSPEALREQEQVREVLRGAGAGDEPLVIIIEAADELREDELSSVLGATAQARRPVILRVMEDVG
jgi:hypothetical protein